MKKANKFLISTQHNKLIQARYTLTLQEKRLILWLISQIQPADKNFKIYKVPLKALAEYIGIDGNKDFYRRLRDITGRLRSRPIDIEDHEKKKLLQMTWLSSAEYSFGEDYLALEFSQKLRPYLLELKNNFTKLQLNAVLSLSSMYAIRIYELVKQYEKLKVRKLPLTELRHYLGMDDDDYDKYNNFKTKVLLIAQREINSKTDLYIEIEEIKKGRRIDEIHFHISPNPNQNQESEELAAIRVAAEPVEVSPELLNKLRYLGLGKQKVLELAAKYGEATIQAKLKDFELAVDSSKEIKNPAGWLISAIEKDWDYRSPLQTDKDNQVELERLRLEQECQAENEKVKREAELKAQRLAFEEELKGLFISRWTALPKMAQDTLMLGAELNKMEKRSYDTKGADKSPSVMMKLRRFVLNDDELDFEDWLEKAGRYPAIIS